MICYEALVRSIGFQRLKTIYIGFFVFFIFTMYNLVILTSCSFQIIKSFVLAFIEAVFQLIFFLDL